jgi:hypothetical protein
MRAIAYANIVALERKLFAMWIYGAYRYLRMFMPVAWATMLFRVRLVATGGGTAITHGSPCKRWPERKLSVVSPKP